MKLLRITGAIGCVFIFSGTLLAQSFSFNCARDTLVAGCSPTPCFTLKAIIPDLRGLSDSYTLNPTSTVSGCAPVYVQPNDPGGTPTNLVVDDTYSSVINIGFPFPFFGTTYTSLIASTNGLVSFDISKANAAAHYIIPSNLPSATYDRAIIMGAYHDLDPSIGSSPTQRIQYQLLGVAPHRRWVFSVYRVPLYSTTGVCDGLIENTQQIILYESTGIIEVTIFSKQICFAWQGGKAMIGMQDFNRTNSIMVPNRRALDPAWGSVGMNESWRFVPSRGPSLFKRVELYDIFGTLITTGTVVNLGNGTLEASFPNICPPAGATTSYIVKPVYEKIDDPLVEIFGSDTIRITKGPPADLNATATTSPTSCGPPSGSITVTVPTGTSPFTYVLDGGTPQTVTAPTYTFTNVSVGPHTVVVTDASGVCNSTISAPVTQNNNLTASVIPNATSCPGVNNGSISVTPTIGTAPYTFTLNPGNVIQVGATASYTGLASGAYTISITDASGCATPLPLNTSIPVGAGILASTSQSATSCAGAINGSITVTPTNGTGPYTFVLDGTVTQNGATTTFNGLTSGIHTIAITDANGCVANPNITVNVASGAVLSATNLVTATSCNGASNGSVLITPTNGTGPYTFVLDGTITQTGATNTSFINLTAGLHSVVVSDASGCVSNPIPIDITAGPLLTTTVSKTDALCNGGATGIITVTQPVIGTAPFQYSLDNVTWQGSNIFPGLIAGTYTVYLRESNGCQGWQLIDVGEPPALTASAATVAVVCNGQSNGIITVTASGGVSPYEYSIDGGVTWQSSNVFNRAAGIHTIIIRDANNCTTPQTITVTEPAILSATSVNGPASCDGGNDGVIAITANGGNAGYQYSLDGITYQPSNVFNVAPGIYNVRVKDNLGCIATFTTTVVLGSNFTLTQQTDPTICEGTSVQLALTSNATQYSWTPSAGLSSTTVFNPVANPIVTTQYIVTATLGRCSADDTVIVNVNAAPIPDAGADGFICYGQTYQLQGSGGTQYSWSPATYLNNTSLSNPISTPTKDITYTLSILSDVNGCASLMSDQIRIDVTPPIKVKTFPFDTIGYAGDQFQLLAIPSDSDVINYSWSPTTGLSDPTIANPVVTVGAIGDVVQYQVSTSTIAGCRGEGYVMVRVYKGPDIYVPTGFTPNNDGKNDKFNPFPVGIKSYKYFRVFNRWGQLVFSTTKLHDGWDGKMGGQDLPNGVYVWMIEGITKDDRVITKKGTVALIR